MIVLASIYKCGIFSSLFEIIKSLSGTDESIKSRFIIIYII